MFLCSKNNLSRKGRKLSSKLLKDGQKGFINQNGTKKTNKAIEEICGKST